MSDPVCHKCKEEASHSCETLERKPTCDACCDHPNACSQCGGLWHCQWFHACKTECGS